MALVSELLNPSSEKMMAAPQYKVILLGDPGVGKTSFFLQLRDSTFVDTDQRPSASIGVEDMEYTHRIGDTEVKVRTGVAY